MTQDKGKETKTTVDSILKGNDLKQFNKAVKTWATMPKDSMNMLYKMNTVGIALNHLYSEGDKKGLKKDLITVIVRDSFGGLNRRERSEYRKLATNFTDIKLFVEFQGIKSANPTYLVNAWIKAVKDDWTECAEIETYLRGAKDVLGNDFGEGGTMTVKPGLESITSEKKGFDNIVRPNERTPEELVEVLGLVINQIKTAFNTGKLKAEHLTDIEKHLTSCLMHINVVDETEDKQATG